MSATAETVARAFGAASPRWKLVAAFAAVYVIWGSTYLAIRFAIETLPPFLMAGLRFLVAGTVLYGWARLRGAPRPRLLEWRSAAVIGGMLLLGGNGAVVWAQKTVPSGIAALLVAIEPLWIVLLDWLPPRPVRPTVRVLLGLGVGFAGVALLVAPWQAGGAVDPIGSLVIVLAAGSWAAGSLYSRRAPLPGSPLAATGMQMLAGGALLTAVGLGAGEAARFDPAAVSAASVAGLAYLVVFGSLVAFTAYAWLLRNAPASQVATYAYVNPVIAVILGWAIAGEAIGLRTVIGAAVIVGAVALLSAVRRGGGAQRGDDAARGAPAGEGARPVVRAALRLRPARRVPPPPVARAACATRSVVSEPEAPAA